MGLIVDPGTALQDQVGGVGGDIIMLSGATGLHQRFGVLYGEVNGNLNHENMDLTDNFDWTGIHTFQSTDLHILSSGAAFDLIFAVATVFTADRTLTVDIGDANRSLTMTGNLVMSGAFNLTLTLTANTNVTFPTTGTLATLNGVETLRSKTLADVNGNELLEFGSTASAVNQFKMTNAATGDDPVLEASGETDVGMTIQGKGTKIVKIRAARTGYVDLGDTGAGTATANMTLGNIFRMRATGNFTLAVSDPSDGQRAIFIVRQDVTGSRLWTVPTNFRWLNGTGATDSTTDKPPLTTTPNKVDIFSGFYDATLNLWWMSVVGFKGAIT